MPPESRRLKRAMPASSRRWPRAASWHFTWPCSPPRQPGTSHPKVGSRHLQVRALQRDCGALRGMRRPQFTTLGASRASHWSAAAPGAGWRTDPLRTSPSRSDQLYYAWHVRTPRQAWTVPDGNPPFWDVTIRKCESAHAFGGQL